MNWQDAEHGSAGMRKHDPAMNEARVFVDGRC